MNQNVIRSRRIFLTLIVILFGSLVGVAIYRVGYSIGVKQTIAQGTAPVLTAKSIAATVDIPLDALLKALNRQPGGSLHLDAVVTMPPGSDDKYSLALFSSGLTLAAALLTAAVGYLYSYFSNRESHRFEWAKFVWDKYEHEYLDFYRVLRSTFDYNILESSFNKLRENAFVPQHIHDKVTAYIKFLRTNDVPSNATQRNLVCSDFDTFVRRPWEHL